MNLEGFMLTIGSLAPDFSLKDKDGNVHKLSDFRGKKVVVYFYPKDNTPGCTRQAGAFRDAYQDFRNQSIEVIGISKDSEASHQKFIEKYNLPFLLLSDPDLEAIKGFGVWQEKMNYGKKTMGVVRSTFVIDEEGKIIKIFPKAKPDSNAQDVLDFLAEAKS